MPGKGRKTERRDARGGRDAGDERERIAERRAGAESFPLGPGETSKHGDPPIEWREGATRSRNGRGER